MKAIETRWKGWRFRSRTEARWAVFMEAAGIRFEYEPEGVLLPSGPYLPDFKLFEFPGSEIPDGHERQAVWLEIKGGDATDEERERCVELAAATGELVLLAEGAPDFSEQVWLFDPDAEDNIRLIMSLAVGPLGFMSGGDFTSSAICLGRSARDPSPPSDNPHMDAIFALCDDPVAVVLGIKNGRLPGKQARLGLSPRMRAAYDAARSARFEFGQTDQRWV